MRRLVSRSAPRPVTKYPSLRLARSVHCESALEVRVAELFDACAGITCFAEQGAELSYASGGVTCRHIPDFFVKAKGRHAFVEVKYRRTITADDRLRAAILTQSLVPLGYDYFLVTEDHVARGAYLDNARYILRRGRAAVSERAKVVLYSRVKLNTLVLGDVLNTADLGHVAAMVLEGILSVPMDEPFHRNIRITLANDGEGMPWAWALLN